MPNRAAAFGAILRKSALAALLIFGGAANCFSLDLSASGPGWLPTIAGHMVSPAGSTLTSSASALQFSIVAGDAEAWEVSATLSVQRTDLEPPTNAPDLMVKGTGDGTATVGSITWASANFITLDGGSTQLFSGVGSRSDIPLQYRTVVSFLNPAGSYEYSVTYTIAAP